MKINVKEIFRFLIVGGIATIIDFFVMSLFIYFINTNAFPNFWQVFLSGKQLSPTWVVVVGTGLGFTISLLFNYILSCMFVFQTNTTEKNKFIKFTLLSLVGLGIHLLGMYIFYDLCGMNEWIIKIILTFVVLIFNYITRKKIIFRS